MKELFPYSLTAILILAVVLSGCGGGNSGEPGGGYTGVAFTMVPVPAVNSFPTGLDDSGTGSVTNPYYIAQTEVTYELWHAVYTWATDAARGANQYHFQNPGVKGNDGAVDKSNQHPVTTVSWRDAIVWCNALTEYYAAKGGTSYQCVYYHNSAYTTPIRSTGDSSIEIYAVAKGFRLPTSMEWELAARYKEGSTWTTGDYASGATAACTDAAATQAVAWYSANSGSSTHPVGGKNANALNLRDMSGNVWEWCFDWYPGYIGSFRVWRGGGWYNDAIHLQVGFVHFDDFPDYAFDYLGFRPVRTQ